jgi:hypothetical protein
VAVEAEAEEAQTTIELVGRDRPGLLSEVFAVLADLRCNVVASEVWTHDGRVAALVHVTDADTLGAIEDPARLDTARRLLRHVLRGSSRDKKAARAAVSARVVEHAPRRLHQMMRADRSARRDGEGEGEGDGERERGGAGMPVVAVEDCAERGYTLVNVRCRDRAKLLFDTVCTLTDMQYVVFHGTVIAEGSEAYQVRTHVLGCHHRNTPIHGTTMRDGTVRVASACASHRAGSTLCVCVRPLGFDQCQRCLAARQILACEREIHGLRGEKKEKQKNLSMY